MNPRNGYATVPVTDLVPASALAARTSVAQLQVERALAKLAARGLAERRVDWGRDTGIRALWCTARRDGLERRRGLGGRIPGAPVGGTGAAHFLAQNGVFL